MWSDVLNYMYNILLFIYDFINQPVFVIRRCGYCGQLVRMIKLQVTARLSDRIFIQQRLSKLKLLQ